MVRDEHREEIGGEKRGRDEGEREYDMSPLYTVQECIGGPGVRDDDPECAEF